MPPPGGTRTDLTMSFQGRANGPMSGVSWDNSSVIFGPGRPLDPIADAQQPRFWDYPVNINSRITPRIGEAFTFRQLRAFSNVEIVRLAIETRKDQMERLRWDVKPTDIKGARGNAEVSARAETLEKFWRKPDGVTPFATWLRLILEDLLVLDAPALERRRTLGGGPRGAGKLIGLDVIPGDTIEPKVDDTGRRPRAPGDVAYQQIIHGVAWADLTNDDLIYTPRNPRPNHHYGFGPVEQTIVTINTVMQRQARQLGYFTEGNIPAGLLVGPEGWNPDQVAKMQAWLDAKLSGQAAEQTKLLWVPGGTKYQSFKEAPLKDDFDEWLARIVAYAFSLPPTPFVRQMNRSTAGEDQERGLEEGLEPLKLWFKRLADGVIQDDLGHPDLEFVWNDEVEVDRVQQREMDDRDLRNGSKTIDEVRDGRGDDPLPDGLGSKPLLYTSTGAVTLESVVNAPSPGELEAQAQEAQVDGTAQPPKPSPKADAPSPAGKPADHGAKSSLIENLAKAAAPISIDRPKARRAIASLQQAIEPILTKVGDHVAAQVGRKLRGLFKADADEENQALAAKLAAEADLTDMNLIIDAVYDDLMEVDADAAKLAMASIGVSNQSGLVDQVNQKAVAYAKQRGAEMVSVQGDKNIIESTRSTIRDIIAQGLSDNIGGDAIAENIQLSQGFSKARAQLISRQEVAMANADGKRNGWDEGKAAGLVLIKGWQGSNDENECPICEANEAQGDIPYDDDFQSGDFMEPAHVRCQCVTTVVASDPAADEA